MNRRRVVFRILIILLMAWVVALSTFVPAVYVQGTALGEAPELPQAVPLWQQANSDGFGDPLAGEVTALESFNGYLYAGIHSDANDARIYRSSDGATWSPVTDPGFGIAHDTAPRAILDFTVFNGSLYASTGRSNNEAKIYRTLSGIMGSWAPVVNSGFADPNNQDITALATYSGKIYAGVANQVTGAHVWTSFDGNSNSWFTTTVPLLADSRITGFAEYAGELYAAVESQGPAQVWVSVGGDWTAVMTNGFGDNDNIYTGGLAVFGGDLYIGAGNASSGAQLYRTNDGSIWAAAITDGFGDANNQKVESLFVYNNQLYASVKNTSTGMEVWRSADGSLWEQANADGFGDSNNAGTNWSNATAEFGASLYAGTLNAATGGELWRLTIPAYGVNLSPNAASAGPPGSSVTYSLWISNTGNVADTIDLVATGIWPTTLSTAQVSLGPSLSAPFAVTVTIPAGAADQASDTATITATSQGDGSVTASATLTTTSVVNPVYGVILSPDATLAGLPGRTVTYTVAITNSGDVADTFSLAPSGESWVTTLSSSSVPLPPGGSSSFKVSVAVPSGALPGDWDTAVITATSLGDGSKAASATLTTTIPRFTLYLPLVTKAP